MIHKNKEGEDTLEVKEINFKIDKFNFYCSILLLNTEGSKEEQLCFMQTAINWK